jgi:myosin heavy subunit
LRIRALEEELGNTTARLRELESTSGTITEGNIILVDELSAERTRTSQLNDSLSAQQSASQRQLTEIERLRKTLNDLDHELRQRSNDLNETKKRADDEKTEKVFFQKQHARLQGDIEALKADAINAAKAQAATAASLVQTQEDLDSTRDELASHICPTIPSSVSCPNCGDKDNKDDTVSVTSTSTSSVPVMDDAEAKALRSELAALRADSERSGRESAAEMKSLKDLIASLQAQLATVDGSFEARNRVIEEAKLTFEALKPRIGVEVNEAPRRKKGVRITAIIPGTPAEQAELAVDDLIIAIDGQPSDVVAAAKAQLAQSRPGQIMKLIVRRGELTLIEDIEVGAIKMTREQVQALRRCAEGNVTKDDLKVNPWTITTASINGSNGTISSPNATTSLVTNTTGERKSLPSTTNSRIPTPSEKKGSTSRIGSTGSRTTSSSGTSTMRPKTASGSVSRTSGSSNGSSSSSSSVTSSVKRTGSTGGRTTTTTTSSTPSSPRPPTTPTTTSRSSIPRLSGTVTSSVKKTPAGTVHLVSP